MAHDQKLEKRIDDLTADWGLTKRRMFGSQAYFLDSSMVFTVRGDGLLFRPDEDAAAGLAERPGVQLAMMGERLMRHWLQADATAVADDKDLMELLVTGRAYVLTHAERPPKRDYRMPL